MAGHIMLVLTSASFIISFGLVHAIDLNSTNGLALEIDSSGQYAVKIDGEIWLTGAPTYAYIDGTKYTSSDGGLKAMNFSIDEKTDVFGDSHIATTNWLAQTKTGEKRITTHVFVYKYVPMIVFKQMFVDPLENTGVGDPNRVSTSYPSFMVDGKGDKGYISYGGVFLRDTKIGKWGTDIKDINSGLYGGPLAIFNKSLDTMVISTANEFMMGSMEVVDNSLNFGVLGSVSSIPVNFNVETMIYYGKGINQAMFDWGAALRKKYGKQTDLMKTDFTINYLGYWTDNGAFYYYNTEPKKTYEDTLLDVKKYTDSVGIPFRYIQIDSWWYYKGDNGGVKNWTAMPSVFPHGLQYLYNNLNIPIAAHNRWWTDQTTYAKENGGKWNFIVEKDTGHAIPQDAAFWDYLLATSREWGLVMYEQDWLNHEFEKMHITLENVTVARTWLLQMGKGASNNGMTIQYCMPMPRHVLQSVEIPAVTQVRASDDYHPGNDQWKVGLSSIMHYAVGLAPFKDTFWTSSIQTGSPYHGDVEPYVQLQNVVATLTTGPVGPSDKVGRSNVSLLMRCCNTDGLILKPTKPITALDLQIYQSAFHSGGPDGEVWSTYSDITAYIFGTLLWVNIKTPYPITPQQAGFGQLGSGYAFSDRDPVNTLVKFDENNPLNQHKCGKGDFGLWHTTPAITVGTNEVLVLGELSKWVKMSPQRVVEIQTCANEIVLTLQGGVGEHVEFTYIYTEQLKTPQVSKCVFPQSGIMQMNLFAGTCSSY